MLVMRVKIPGMNYALISIGVVLIVVYIIVKKQQKK
jgi:hypothetical protein